MARPAVSTRGIHGISKVKRWDELPPPQPSAQNCSGTTEWAAVVWVPKKWSCRTMGSHRGRKQEFEDSRNLTLFTYLKSSPMLSP